jgi:hypothetical protein
MAKINSWYGRLGNNILQIGNALVVAYLNRSVFTCPSHDLFPAFSVPFGYTPPSMGNFFHLNLNAYGGAQKFMVLRSNLLKEYFLPKLNVPELNTDISNLLINGALVAHARGGDTFNPNLYPSYSISPAYIPHPLDYYLHLAKSYEKVILVYEDKTNPVVDALSENPQFYLTTNDVLTDFAIFTKAKSVALGGFGTFVPSACLLNKNLSKIYFSNVTPLHEYLADSDQYEKVYLNLLGYIDEDKWVADNTQKNLMLNYKLPIS